jgi:hypothetical protein
MENDNLLLEIGGKELYFDIDKLSDVVKIENKVMDNVIIKKESIDNDDDDIMDDSAIQIDITKYELYREMIATILGYMEEIDDKMGSVALNKTNIPFKMAYNTLLMKGIIKEL